MVTRRYWAIVVGMLVLDSVVAHSNKISKAKTEIIHLEERLTENERELVDFGTSVALEGTILALSVANPFVGLTAGFIVGTLVSVIWPTDSYNAIRAKVIEDIKKEMNLQSVERMEMKLRDYKRQIQNLFSMLSLPNQYLVEWQNSVEEHGVNLSKQQTIIQQYQQNMSNASFTYFQNSLLALTTDISNDRETFLIPSDPASSLAHYREFATIELNLLAAELTIQSVDQANSHIINVIHKKMKSAAKRHYKFFLWAAHKVAVKLEATGNNTNNWKKYNDNVESVLKECPMQQWKIFSGLYDDSKFIRFEDAIALKNAGSKESWMSCWVSGSQCETRPCPGVDNPFETGDQYSYYYKCRGEIFWIAGSGRYSRSYIKVCDKVGIQYSYSVEGYWLSYDEDWANGKFYNTRTCPGRNFFKGNFDGSCRSEQFTIHVPGKKCGELLEDRDTCTLTDRNNKYVADKYHHLLRPSNNKPVDRVWWRIYKIYSLIKSYH